MPFVRRDETGRVVAISLQPLDGFEEVAPGDAALEVLGALAPEPTVRLRASDLDVVRVLDDLINLLIEKNTIRFTDLPEAAQRKLMERRGLREKRSTAGLLGDDEALL